MKEIFIALMSGDFLLSFNMVNLPPQKTNPVEMPEA